MTDLQLVKALKTVAKNQDSFTKSVTALSELCKDVLEGLDLELERKKRELKDVDEEVAATRKTKRIKLDQELEEHGYKKAVQLLTMREEVPIKKAESESLLLELSGLKATMSKDIKDGIDKVKERERKASATALKTMELEFKAKHAELQATCKQKDMEISVLNQTITSLKEDVDKQRALTQAVAESSKPQYYGQTTSMGTK